VANAGASEQRDDFELRRRAIESGRPTVLVETKSDLPEPCANFDAVGSSLPVSAKTGAGLDELVERCARLLSDALPDRGDVIGTTAARCRESLSACRDALGRSLSAAESNRGDEILALELREALEHLGRVLGTVYTDDILDRLFSRFCIGK
jgi:tRNA modification GTPase